MTTTAKPTRLAFSGSCHCRQTRYIVFYTLPHMPHSDSSSLKHVGQRIYKCNCTTCQKLSIFHTRVNEPASDFLLLSPLDPLGPDSSLTAYRYSEGGKAWLFCKTCGGRCFSFKGPDEVVSVDLAGLGVGEDVCKRAGAEVDDQGRTTVWKPKDGFVESPEHRYLSVNAHSLDAEQEGLDLREWHEQGCVQYYDLLKDSGETRYWTPFEGGIY